MVSIVLRLLPYIAAVSLVVGVGWYTIDSAYEHGRKMERLEWMEHEEVLKRQADIRIAQLEYRMKTERDKADRRATQIIGDYANEIEKLHTDLNSVNDKRLYITAKATACEADRNAMSSANKDTGGDGGRVRFEIPEETSREIWRDGILVEKLEDKHNALTRLIKSAPHCFEIVR